jgi:hypothetical protein
LRTKEPVRVIEFLAPDIVLRTKSVCHLWYFFPSKIRLLGQAPRLIRSFVKARERFESFVGIQCETAGAQKARPSAGRGYTPRDGSSRKPVFEDRVPRLRSGGFRAPFFVLVYIQRWQGKGTKWALTD